MNLKSWLNPGNNPNIDLTIRLLTNRLKDYERNMKILREENADLRKELERSKSNYRRWQTPNSD